MKVDINNSIDILKGVGPKAKESLNKCNIYTCLDLLLYFPRGYEAVNVVDNLNAPALESKSIIFCTVEEIKKDTHTGNGKLVTTILFRHGDNIIYGKWFNQPYIKNSFILAQEYQLLGMIKKYKNQDVIINPKVIKGISVDSRIIPKYSLTKDITANFIGKLVLQILEYIKVSENLPNYLIEKYKLCPLNEAIRSIHYPENSQKLEEAKRRLKFQELFTFSMKILMLKRFIKSNNDGFSLKISPELIALKEALPYKLTEAQNKVIREILVDEKKATPMNRLVQGDVGSGKTIVSIIAMFNVVKNGYQAAMMAPTEILANQHYHEVTKILQGFNVKVRLLTGSSSMKIKNEIKESLAKGEIDILIGTHALIEDNVIFSKLGMIVTDEQHRFGVHQRALLYNKNTYADVLVMTATPIPRTLSLYLYGDLDISVIDELPPGRKKIKTSFIQCERKQSAYNLALEEIKKGRQVYIVCPLIEDNDELKLTSVSQLYIDLKNKFFKDISVSILHGKMNQSEKTEIMNNFKEGNIKVLVSTTVIEVGVNIPNASVMIVENAERFGLSQLHQLRGRVGRGGYESYCILIGNAKSPVTKKRMRIMVESNDGFYIAEQDLKIRGTGDWFGSKQSGDNELVLSDIMEDINILKVANMEAKRLLDDDNPQHNKIKDEIITKLEHSKRYICFN